MKPMKTIISIWHSGGKGKTSTVREIATILLDRPNIRIIHPEAFTADDLRGDFSIVIEINNIKIGLESQGDPGTDLRSRLEKLTSKEAIPRIECDLIFCTTRTRGETVRDVNFIADQFSYEVIWTSTYQISNEQLRADLNLLKARHLIDLVENLGFRLE